MVPVYSLKYILGYFLHKSPNSLMTARQNRSSISGGTSSGDIKRNRVKSLSLIMIEIYH